MAKFSIRASVFSQQPRCGAIRADQLRKTCFPTRHGHYRRYQEQQKQNIFYLNMPWRKLPLAYKGYHHSQPSKVYPNATRQISGQPPQSLRIGSGECTDIIPPNRTVDYLFCCGTKLLRSRKHFLRRHPAGYKASVIGPKTVIFPLLYNGSNCVNIEERIISQAIIYYPGQTGSLEGCVHDLIFRFPA